MKTMTAGTAERAGTAETAGDELSTPAPDVGADGPVVRQTFAHWPLPVGRVDVRDGLAFVYSTEPGGFSVDDHRRIPGGGHIELLDGVAVVSPVPTRGHQRVVLRLYRVLSDACPQHLEPFIGPLDVGIGAATVFEPDIVVLPPDDDAPPVLVVEVLSAHGRSYDRRVKFHGYRQAGVPSYWIVDPDTAAVTIFELDDTGSYREAGSYACDDLCVVERPFPIHFRPTDLI